MSRKYYAAVLKEDEYFLGGWHKKFSVGTVYAFDYFSQRKQWLTENSFPEGQRVIISSRIAKKHPIVSVEFREAMRLGSKCWTWMYDKTPDWLSNV